MSARRIQYIPLTDIKRAHRNPKTHDTDAITGSLTRFGLGELPLLDERTGLLVAGEGRINTLVALHAADPAHPPEGIVLTATGDWEIPTITGWASTDDREADAYLVASNRLSERGGWDSGALADLLTSLDGHLDGLGYDQHDLDEMLLPAQSAADPDADPGAPPPDPLPDWPTPAQVPAPRPAPAAAPLWTPLNFATTAEQHDTVQAALDLARSHGHGPPPAAALTAVCQFYLDSADGE